MDLATKDISDEVMLTAIVMARLAHGVSLTWDIAKRLEPIPEKLVVAKLKSMLKRKLIDGCGCRGDWKIV